MLRQIAIGLFLVLGLGLGLGLLPLIVNVLSASDTSLFRMLVLKSEEDLKRTTDFRICATYRWRAVITGATPAITNEVERRNLDCSVLPLGPTTYFHPPVRIPKLAKSKHARGPVEGRKPSAEGSRGSKSGYKSKLIYVQELLKRKGFYKGKVDGIYGPETNAALKAFKAQQGLSGTGKLDHATSERVAAKPAHSADRSLAQAAYWQIRRGNSTRGCSIQRADSRPPPLGKLLTSKPNVREACIAGRSLRSKNANDTSRCFNYTPNTRRLCARHSVDLR